MAAAEHLRKRSDMIDATKDYAYENWPNHVASHVLEKNP